MLSTDTLSSVMWEDNYLLLWIICCLFSVIFLICFKYFFQSFVMVVCDDPFEVKLGDNYEVGVIISYFDWFFNLYINTLRPYQNEIFFNDFLLIQI